MAIALRGRSEADRLSHAFGRALGGAASTRWPEVGALLGLEHEFRVLVEGRPIDFGRLVHHLPIPGLRLDPTDPNAYRGAWGGAITADGREAEIAIAPVARGPGCTAELLERSRVGRSRLAGSLPPGARLEGFSTHMSVAVPDRLVERTAQIYLRTFAPALMLLLDGPDSPGLLVRPRPGRLELGGEYVDGERLQAVAAFVAGSVAVAAAAARRLPFAGRGLPAALQVRSTPAIDRYGWFVARDAFGSDLYATGRRTVLHLRRGGTTEAGTRLSECWAIARRAIEGLVAPADLAAADRLVAGQEALGIEGTQAGAIAFHESVARAATTKPDPFGLAVATRSRPGFSVTPAIVSWDFVVLRLQSSDRAAYACLPRQLLGAGLEALDDGRLDVLLRGYLSMEGRTQRVLAAKRQTNAAGLYGAVGRAANLLAHERSPLGPPGDRPGKRRRDDRSRGDDRSRDARQQPTPQRPRPGRTAARSVGGSVAAGTGAAATAGGTAAAGTGSAATGAAGTAGATFFGVPAALAAGIVVVALIAVVGGVAASGLLSGSPASTATPTPSASSSPSSRPSPSPRATARATPAHQVLPDASCEREPTLRSTSGADPHEIRFVNKLEFPVQTIWLNYEGQRVFYREVAPGDSYLQPTWVTHPWILANLQGTCQLLIVVDEQTGTVQIGP